MKQVVEQDFNERCSALFITKNNKNTKHTLEITDHSSLRRALHKILYKEKSQQFVSCTEKNKDFLFTLTMHQFSLTFLKQTRLLSTIFYVRFVSVMLCCEVIWPVTIHRVTLATDRVIFVLHSSCRTYWVVQ